MRSVGKATVDTTESWTMICWKLPLSRRGRSWGLLRRLRKDELLECRVGRGWAMKWCTRQMFSNRSTMKVSRYGVPFVQIPNFCFLASRNLRVFPSCRVAGTWPDVASASSTWRAGFLEHLSVARMGEWVDAHTTRS